MRIGGIRILAWLFVAAVAVAKVCTTTAVVAVNVHTFAWVPRGR